MVCGCPHCKADISASTPGGLCSACSTNCEKHLIAIGQIHGTIPTKPAEVMKPSRWQRIFGMVILFTMPTAFLIDMLHAQHWRYAAPVLWAAIVTGGFAGEVWHRRSQASS